MHRASVRLNQFLQRMMQQEANEKGSRSHRKEYFTAYLHRINGGEKMNNPILHAWSACVNQNLNLNKHHMVCVCVCVYVSAKIGEHRREFQIRCEAFPSRCAFQNATQNLIKI